MVGRECDAPPRLFSMEHAEPGPACADICRALNRGMNVS